MYAGEEHAWFDNSLPLQFPLVQVCDVCPQQIGAS